MSIRGHPVIIPSSFLWLIAICRRFLHAKLPLMVAYETGHVNETELNLGQTRAKEVNNLLRWEGDATYVVWAIN